MITNYSDSYINSINTDNWNDFINDYNTITNTLIDGNNVLHMACIRGKDKIIDSILEKFPDLFYLSNENGDICSFLLAKHGWFDILKKVIINHYDSLSFINNDGNTLFQIIYNQFDLLIWTINILSDEKLDVLNNVNNNNLTLLLQLIILYKNNPNSNSKSIINFLLDKNIETNRPSILPPLLYSINNNIYDIVYLLLNKNANPDIKDTHNNRPLFTSIKNNSYEITELLLKYNANINILDLETNYLPLNLTIINKNENIYELLLKYKPNFDIQDKFLNIPLHYLLQSNMKSQWLKSSLIFESIYKSNINSKNLRGVTPLHILNMTDNWKLYTEILKIKNIDINIIDNKKKTPISYLKKKDIPYFLNTTNPSIIKEKCYIIDDIQKCQYNNIYENNIIMPDTIHTNFGQFNADILHNIIYTMLLLEKYDNLMIPFQYKFKDKEKNDIRNLEAMNLFKTTSGELLYNIISIYHEYFYEISPHIIIWKDNDINYIDKNLHIYISKLLKNTKIRFILIKLTILPTQNSSHANVILYDKELCELYRFEPYGIVDIYDSELLDKTIKHFFKKNINNDFTYYRPKDYLQNSRFQFVSNESDMENKKSGDPFGYCLAFSLWFIEVKIKNPNSNIEKLMNMSLEKMTNQEFSVSTEFYEWSTERNINSNPILNYIRNYANKLDKMSTSYLKYSGINEIDVYSISFNEKNMNNILNYTKSKFYSLIKKKGF